MALNNYKQSLYDEYNDEVAQVEKEYAEGKITADQLKKYLVNLHNNLQTNLDEIES